MADKSWGTSPSPAFGIRTNASPEERAADRANARAEAREGRAGERSRAMADRIAARAVDREADTLARERERVERREREQEAATGDPHADAARRHRSSGRKDVVREQRDTRGYATVVDENRMRELSRRGASVAGLAGAFGIGEDEVERLLAIEQQPGE